MSHPLDFPRKFFLRPLHKNQSTSSYRRPRESDGVWLFKSRYSLFTHSEEIKVMIWVNLLHILTCCNFKLENFFFPEMLTLSSQKKKTETVVSGQPSDFKVKTRSWTITSLVTISPWPTGAVFPPCSPSLVPCHFLLQGFYLIDEILGFSVIEN